MSEEQMFRSVAFGGFHKLDVLNYIETSTAAHKAKVAELERALAEAEKAAAQAEQTAARAAEGQAQAAGRTQEKEAEAEKRRAEAEALTKRLEESLAETEGLKAELEAAGARAAKAEEENKSLREQLTKAAPEVEAYRKLRSRAASIELEARRRAQAIQTAAEERAEETKAEVERWTAKVLKTYEQLRTDVEATISHAADELNRSKNSLAEASGRFSTHDYAMRDLLRAYQETEPAAEEEAAPSPEDAQE